MPKPTNWTVPAQVRPESVAILGLGVAFAASHVYHYLAHAKPLLADVVGVFIPILLALTIVYAGLWTTQLSWRQPWIRHLTLWTYCGAVAMGVVGGLLMAHQALAGTLTDDAPFLLITAATAGALGGFLIGFYQSRYRRKAERIETIHDATSQLMAAETKAAVCDQAVTIAAERLGMGLSGIWLADAEKTRLELAAQTANGKRLIDEPPVYEASNSISWEVFSEGTARYIPDARSHPDVYNPETPIRSEIILPLGDHGVFNLGSQRANAFDDSDVTTAKILASTTAAALDQTEREELLRTQQEELAEQAAQLEDFARTISHDLRNPLNVARVRLDLAKDDSDPTHFQRADDALDRIERIIDDLLWLATEGKQIGSKEGVDLESRTRRAWEMVDTADADLRCDCDRVVCADSDRLQQLLENLLRNAVEHGGDDVTVTVGTTADGFYVEDTGNGFTTDGDDIFEAGFSTADGGTGFGLSIVEEIVTAHGWEITATESPAGGARFEITGADAVDESCCATAVAPTSVESS